MLAPPPTTVLRGHRSEVTSVRFAPWADARGQPTLLSGSGDGELRAWSLRTHRSVVTIAAHSGKALIGIHALGGGRIITQGRDGFVRIWDLERSGGGGGGSGHCGGGGGSTPLLEHNASCLSFCQAVPAPSAAPGVAHDGVPPLPPLVALPSEDATEVSLVDLRQQPAAEAARLLPIATRERAGMLMCLHFLGEHDLLAGWEDGTLQRFDLRAPGRVVGCAPLLSEPLP